MPGFLLLHVRQRRGDAVEHALDVDVDHPVPFVDLEPFERRVRHQAGVVEHHVDAAVGLHGRVDQVLDLIAVGDVGGDGQGLAAAAVSSSASAWMRSARRAPSTTVAPSRGEVARRGFAQPAAGAGDDDDFAFDVVAHIPAIVPCCWWARSPDGRPHTRAGPPYIGRRALSGLDLSTQPGTVRASLAEAGG